MDLFKPKTLQGEWIPFGDDAEVLVRLIPNDVDAKFNKTRYGDETDESIKKKGGDHLAAMTLQAYLLDRACYALVDTKNVWAPADLLTAKGITPQQVDAERREDGMVRLDGHWDEPTKRAVLGELMQTGYLGFWVMTKSRELAAKAEDSKDRLGKA